MALIIHCDCCNEELDEPGALLIGPPVPESGCWEVIKYHICIECFFVVRGHLNK